MVMRHNVLWLKRIQYARVPQPPVATQITATSIKLVWLTDPLAASYTLQRSDTQNGPWTNRVTGLVLSFTDTGLTEATPYWYRILVALPSGQATASAPTLVTTTDLSSPPNTPTGLMVVDETGASIELSWTDQPDATSYVLQRRPAAP